MWPFNTLFEIWYRKLRQTAYRSYYLRTPHWEWVREMYLKENPTCEWGNCHRKAQDIHHLKYTVNGKSVLFFEHTYKPMPLRAFCRYHHEAVHRRIAKRKWEKTLLGKVEKTVMRTLFFD